METKTKSVGIIGYYNQENYGDDLLAFLFFNYVNSISENNAIIFNPSDSLKSTILNGKYYYSNKNIPECSHVIFGGGGVLGELNNSRFGWRIFIPYLKKILICKKHRIPYYFICVGAGPIRSIVSKKIVKYMVKNAKYTIVRDHESLEILKSIGIKRERLFEAVDFALKLTPKTFSLPTKERFDLTKKNNGAFTLGINLCDFNCHEKLCEANVDSKIIDTLQLLYNESLFKNIVVIVSMLNGPESIGALKVLKAFPHAKLHIHDNILKTTSVLNSVDFLVTQKLHVSIVAYKLNIPTACIGYHPKIERFFKQVNATEFYTPMTNTAKINQILRNLFKKPQEHPFVLNSKSSTLFKEKLDSVDSWIKDHLS